MTHALQYALDRLPAVPGELWHVLLEMAPYLLLGFLMAGVLSVFLSPGAIERHLGGRGLWPIVKASLFGLPLPLCSCGVIPVAASLRRHGASRGATVSFLISTPQTGAENIAVTYSLLGGVFAIFAPIATIISGLVGGILVDWADRRQVEHHGNPDGATPPACQGDCCSAEGANKGRLRRIAEFGFVTLPRDLVKPLAFGVVVAAVIAAMLPGGFFTEAFGGVLATGVLGILVMMALGIPVYVCATASIPMAWALVDKGVSPGAAFAFLVVGPATNAATLAMVWKVMGRRTALIYLGTMMASAMAGGLILDFFFTRTDFHLASSATMETASGAWHAFEIACVIGLLGVLGYSMFRGHPKEELAAEGIDTEGFDVATVAVEGLDCEHCAGPVQQALLAVERVESARVDLHAQTVRVAGEALDEQTLREAIEGAGYHVKSVSLDSPRTHHHVA